jgi:hypothetical protein
MPASNPERAWLAVSSMATLPIIHVDDASS